MADEKIENYGLKASFGFEVNKKSIVSMDTIQTQLAGIEDAVNETSAAVKSSGLGGNIGKITSQITKQMRPLKAEFRALKAEMRNLEFGDLTDSKQFGNASKSVNRYINSLKHLQSQIHGNTAEEREFTSVLRQQQRLAKNRLDMNVSQREATKKAMQVGEYKFVRDAGKLLVNEKSVSIAKDFVSTYAGFDDTMAAVSSAIEDHGEQYEKLRQKASLMGATTRFTAKEAAEAEKNLAMAGLNATQILAALPATLSAASAGQLGLGEATDISTKAMAGFKLEARQINHIADVLAKSANATNTNIQELGTAMSYAAPGAVLFRASIEETAGAIGIMSNAGVSADKAGTAMRSMFLRLANPPAKAKKSLQQWGISVTDSAGNMRNFVDVLDDVATKLQITPDQIKTLSTASEAQIEGIVSQSEQLTALQNISGTTGISGFAALLNDRAGLKKTILMNLASSSSSELLKQVLTAQGLQMEEKEDIYDALLKQTGDDYQKARDILNQASGIAMSANLSNSLDGKQVAQLQSVLSGQGVDIGRGEDIFSAVFKKFPDTQKAISIINTSLEELGFQLKEETSYAKITAKVMEDNLAGSFRAFGSALESVKVSFIDPLIPAIRLIIDTATKFLLFLTGLPAPVRATITITAALVTGLGALSIAVGIAGATLAAFSQALLVTELAEKSLATGLIPLTGFFATSLQAYEGTDPIANVLKTLQLGFTKLREPLGEAKIAMFGLGRASLAFALSPAGLAIVALTGLYVLLEKATPQVSLLGTAITALASPFAFVFGLVKGFLGEVWKILAEVLGLSGEIVSQPFVQITKSIQSALVSLAKISDFAESIGKGVAQTLGILIRLPILGMRKTWEAMVGVVSIPLKAVTNAFDAAVKHISQAWEGFIQGFGGNLVRIIQPALDVAQGLINALNHNPTVAIPASWQGAVEKMQGYLTGFWEFAVGIGKNISRTVKGIFNEITYEMIPDLITGIDNSLRDLTGSITSIGTLIVNSLKQGFNEFIYEIIPDFVTSIVDNLSPLTDGVSNLLGGVRKKQETNNIVPFSRGLAMMPVGVIAENIGNIEAKQVNEQMSNTVSILGIIGQGIVKAGQLLWTFFITPLIVFTQVIKGTINLAIAGIKTIIGLGSDLYQSIFNEDAEKRTAARASFVRTLTQGVVGFIAGSIAAVQKVWQGMTFYFGLVDAMIPAAIKNLDTFGLLMLSLSALPGNLVKNLYSVEQIQSAANVLGAELVEFGLMMKSKMVTGLSLGLPGLVAIAIATGWNKGIEKWMVGAIADFPYQIAILEEKIYGYLSSIPDDLLLPLASVGVSPGQFKDTLSQINSFLQDFIYGPLTQGTYYLLEFGYAANKVGEQIVDMLRPLLDFKILFFRPIQSMLVITPAFQGLFNILTSETFKGALAYLGTIATFIGSAWASVAVIFTTFVATLLAAPLSVFGYIREITSQAVQQVAGGVGEAAQEAFDLGKAVGSFFYSVARSAKNWLIETVSKIPVIGTHLAAGIEKTVQIAKAAFFHIGNIVSSVYSSVEGFFPIIGQSLQLVSQNLGRVITEFMSGIAFALTNIGKAGKTTTVIFANFWKLYRQTTGFKDLVKGITLLDLFYDKLFPDQKIVAGKTKEILNIRKNMVAALAKTMGMEVDMTAETGGLRGIQKFLLGVSPMVELASSLVIGLFTLRAIVEPLSNDFIGASTHVQMFGHEVNAAGIVVGGVVGAFLMLSGISPIFAAIGAGLAYFGSNAYVLMGLRTGIILLTDAMLLFAKVAKKGFEIVAAVTANLGDIVGAVTKYVVKGILAIAYGLKLLVASPILFFVGALALGWGSWITLAVGGIGLVVSGLTGFAAIANVVLVVLQKLAQGYKWLVRTVGQYMETQIFKYSKAYMVEGWGGIIKQFGVDTLGVLGGIWNATAVKFANWIWSLRKPIWNAAVQIGQSVAWVAQKVTHPIETAREIIGAAVDFITSKWAEILPVIAAIGLAVYKLIFTIQGAAATSGSGIVYMITQVATAQNKFLELIRILKMVGVAAGISTALLAIGFSVQQYIENFKTVDLVIRKLGDGIRWTSNLLANLVGLITKPISPGIADALGGFIDNFITYLPHIVIGLGIIGLVISKAWGIPLAKMISALVSIVGLFGKLVGFGWQFGKTVKNAATGLEAQTRYMEVAYNVRSRAKGTSGLGYESDQVEGLRLEQIEKSKALVKARKMFGKYLEQQRKGVEKELLNNFKQFPEATGITSAKYGSMFKEVEKRTWLGGTKKKTELTNLGASERDSRISSQMYSANPSDIAAGKFTDDKLLEIFSKSGAAKAWLKYLKPGDNADIGRSNILDILDSTDTKNFFDSFDQAVLSEQTVKNMYVGSLNLSGKASDEIDSKSISQTATKKKQLDNPFNYVFQQNDAEKARTPEFSQLVGKNLTDVMRQLTGEAVNQETVLEFLRNLSSQSNENRAKIGDILPRDTAYTFPGGGYTPPKAGPQGTERMSALTDQILGYKTLSAFGVLSSSDSDAAAKAYLPSQIKDELMKASEFDGYGYTYNEKPLATLIDNLPQFQSIKNDGLSASLQAQIEGLNLDTKTSNDKKQQQVKRLVHEYTMMLLEEQDSFLKNIQVEQDDITPAAMKPLTENLEQNKKKIRIGFKDVVLGAFTDFFTDIGGVVNAVTNKVTSIPTIRNYLDTKENAARLAQDKKRMDQVARIKKEQKIGSDLEMLQGSKYVSSNVDDFLKNLLNPMSRGTAQQRNISFGSKTLQDLVSIISTKKADEANKELKKETAAYRDLEQFIKNDPTYQMPSVNIDSVEKWIKMMQNQDTNSNKFSNYAKGELEKYNIGASKDDRNAIASAFQEVMFKRKITGKDDKGNDIYGDFIHQTNEIYNELTRLGNTSNTSEQRGKYKLATQAILDYEQAAKKAGQEGIGSIFDVIGKFRYGDGLGSAIERAMNDAGIAKNIGSVYDGIQAKYIATITDFKNVASQSINEGEKINGQFIDALSTELKTIIQDKFKGSDSQMVDYLNQLIFKDGKFGNYRNPEEIFKKLVQDRLIPELQDKDAIEKTFGLRMNDLRSTSFGSAKEKLLLEYIAKGQLNAPEIQQALKSGAINNADIFSVFGSIAEKGNVNPFQLYDPSLSNKQIRQSRTKRKGVYGSMTDPASESYSQEFTELFKNMTKQQQRALVDARLDKLPQEQVQQLGKIFSTKFETAANYADIMLDVLSPQKMLEEEGFFAKMSKLYAEIKTSKVSTKELFLGVFSGLMELPKELFKGNAGALLNISSYRAELAKIQNEVVFAEQKQARDEATQIKAGQEARKRGLQTLLTQNKLNKKEVYEALGDLGTILDQFLDSGKFYQEASKEDKNKMAQILKVKDQKGVEGLRGQLKQYDVTSFKKDAKGNTIFRDGKAVTETTKSFNLIDPFIEMIQEGSVRGKNGSIAPEHKDAILQIFSKMGVQNEMQMTQLLKQLNKDGTGMTDALIEFLRSGSFVSEVIDVDKDALVDVLGLNNFQELENIADRRLSFFDKIQFQIVNYVNGVIDAVKLMDTNILNALERLKEIPIIGGLLYRIAVPVYKKISGVIQGVGKFLGGILGFIDQKVQAMPGLRVFNSAKQDYQERASTSLPSLIKDAGYGNLTEFAQEFYGRLEEKGIKDEKEQRKALMAFLQPNEKGAYNTLMSDKGLQKNSKVIIESFAASIEKPFNTAEKMLRENKFTTAAVAPLQIFYLKVLPKSIADVLFQTTKFLAIAAPLVIAKGIGFALKKVGFADWFMGYWNKFRKKTGIEYIFDNISNRVKASMNKLNANIVGGLADKINNIRLAGYFPMLLGAVEKFFGKISNGFAAKADQLDAEFAKKGKFNTQGLISVLQKIFELTINSFKKVEQETKSQQQSWISKVMTSVSDFGRNLWEIVKGVGRKFKRSPENIRADIAAGGSRIDRLNQRKQENRLKINYLIPENLPEGKERNQAAKQKARLQKEQEKIFSQIKSLYQGKRSLETELQGKLRPRLPRTNNSTEITSISALKKQLKLSTKQNDIAKVDEINTRITALQREAEILRQERLSLRREKWKSFFQVFKNWAGSLSGWATSVATKMGDITKGIKVKERRAGVYSVKEEVLAERRRSQSNSLPGINAPSVGDAPKAFVSGAEINEYAANEVQKMKNWYADGKGADVFVIPFQKKIRQGIVSGIGAVAKWISSSNFDERLAHFFTSPVESIVAMWGSAGRIIKNAWGRVSSFFSNGAGEMVEKAKKAGRAIKNSLNHNAADATRLAWQKTVNFFSGNVPKMVGIAKNAGRRIVGFLNHRAADTTAEAWERSQQVVSNEMHQMADTAATVGPQIAGSMEQSAKRSVSAFAKLQGMIQHIGKAGFAVGGAITAAGFAAQTIAFSLGNLGFVSEEQSQALYKMTEIFTIFGAVTGLVSPILGALFSSLGAIGSVAGFVVTGIAGIGGAIFTFLVSPVGLAVAGITAGIFMLNTLIKNVFGVDILQGLISSLIGGISSAFNFIVSKIPGLASGISNAIAPLGEQIKPVLSFIWQGIQDIFLVPFAPVLEKMQPVIDGVKGAFQQAIAWITGAWQGFVDKFGGRLMPIIQPALDVAQGLINALNHSPTERIPEAWEGAVATMQGYLGNFLKFSIGIASALTSAFAAKTIFGMMQSKGMTTAVQHTQKIGGKIKGMALYANMFNDIAELTGVDLPDFVEPLIKATTFVGVLGDVAETVLPIIGAGFTGLGGAITGAFSAAAAAVGGVFPLIGIAIASVTALTLAWNTNLFDIQGKTKIAADFVSEAFKNSVVQISFAWQSFVDNFGGKLSAIVQPALDVAQKLINALNHNPTVVIPASWQGATESIKESLNSLPETGKSVGNQLNNFLSSGIDKTVGKINELKHLFGTKSPKPGDASFIGPMMPPSNNIVSADGLRKPSQPGNSDFIGPVLPPQSDKPKGFWGGLAGLFGGSSKTVVKDEVEPALLDFTKQLAMAVTIAKSNNDTVAVSDLEAMQLMNSAKGGLTANEYAKTILTPDYSAGQYLKSAQVLTNSGIEGYSLPEAGSKDFIGPVMPEPEKKLGFWGSIGQMFGAKKQEAVKVDDELAPALLDFTKQLDIAIKLANYDKDTEAVTNLKALQAVSGGQLTSKEYAQTIMTPDSSMGKYLKTGQSMVGAINNPITIGDVAGQAGRDLKIFSTQLSSQANSELENLGLEFGDRWRYLQENGFINTDEIVTGLGDVRNSFTTLASDAWGSITRLDLPGLQRSFANFGDNVSGAFTRITNGFALVGEIFEPGAEQMGAGLGQLGDSFKTFAGEAWDSLIKLDFGGFNKAAADFGVSAWGAMKQIKDGFGSMSLSAIAFGVFSLVSLSPVLAIMGGIGLAAVGLATNFLGIRDIIFGVTKVFIGLLRIVGAIAGAIRGIYQGIQMIASGVLTLDGNFIKAGIDRVTASVTKGVEGVTKGIQQAWGGIIQTLQGGLRMFQGLVGIMANTLLLPFRGVRLAVLGLRNTFLFIAQSLVNAVLNPKQAWQGFLNLLTRIRDQAVNVMRAVGSSAVSRVSNLVKRKTEVASTEQPNPEGKKGWIGGLFGRKKAEVSATKPESADPIIPGTSSALPKNPANNQIGGSNLKANGDKAVGRNRFGSGLDEPTRAFSPGLVDNISQLGFALSGISPAIAQPLILVTSLAQSFNILKDTLTSLFPTLVSFVSQSYAAGGVNGVLAASFAWLSATSSAAWISIQTTATSLWGYITSTFAASGASGLLSSSLAWLAGWGSSVIASIIGVSASLWGFVASTFAAAVGAGSVSAAFGVLGGAAATAWTAVLAPLVPFILGTAAVVGAVLVIYAVFRAAFSWLGAFFKGFFDTLLGGFGEIFSGIVDSVKQSFSDIVATFQMIGAAIMKPLQPLIELFGNDASSGFFGGVGWLLAQALLLPFRILGFLITAVVKGIALIIQGISILGGLIAAVVLSPFYIISGLVKGIQVVMSGIGSIFTSIFQAIGDGMRSVVDFMRGIPLIGQLIEWVSPKKEDTPKYAKGGLINGPGSSTGDRISILASRGEYMVNSVATKQNYGLLEAMNNGEELPGVTAMSTPAPRIVQPPIREDYGASVGAVAMPPMEFNFTFGDIIVQGGSSAEMVNDFLENLEPKLEQKMRELMRRMMDFMK